MLLLLFEDSCHRGLMMVRYPFHKLCYLPVNQQGRQILLAAAGHTIQSLSFPEGKLLGCWPSQESDDSNDESVAEGHAKRPAKRRRLNNGVLSSSPDESDASELSIEIVAEGRQRQKGERRKPKIPDLRLPNVSHILTTSDGKNAITVTAEDKAVRVFNVSRRGRLRQLTSR